MRAVVLLLLVACHEQELTPDARVEVALVPTSANSDLDLLFVIDDSTALLDTQIAVVSAFPSLTDQLDALSSGRPNLHVGVVSPDLGTLGALDSEPGPSIGSGPGSCSGSGKAGILQNPGSIVTGRYIVDLATGDTRTTNYSGSIGDAFKSIASLGSYTCGFEQHLQAMKRGLENNVENAGFLRLEARLAVIVFTDEDDCSFAHSSFVSTDTSLYGPLQSFRCSHFGITCDVGGATPDEMNELGPKSNCHANETAEILMHPSDYVTFLQSLKADPRDVMFGTLAGDPIVDVELITPPGGGAGTPALANICAPHDAIAPSVRLAEMPAQLHRGSFESVCASDMRPAMTSFGRQLRNLVGDACLARDIALPADCRVFDQTRSAESELPLCDKTIVTDCYQLVEDPSCTAGQHLRVDVIRSALPSPDTMVSVRCLPEP